MSSSFGVLGRGASEGGGGPREDFAFYQKRCIDNNIPIVYVRGPKKGDEKALSTLYKCRQQAAVRAAAGAGAKRPRSKAPKPASRSSSPSPSPAATKTPTPPRAKTPTPPRVPTPRAPTPQASANSAIEARLQAMPYPELKKMFNEYVAAKRIRHNKGQSVTKDVIIRKILAAK